MGDEDLNQAHRAGSPLGRLHLTRDGQDPVSRLVEDRERRDAMRDVERRRLEEPAAAATGRVTRISLP